MKRPTKAQCARAAELATEEELQRLSDINKISVLGQVFEDPATLRQAAEEARAWVYEILKRDEPAVNH